MEQSPPWVRKEHWVQTEDPSNPETTLAESAQQRTDRAKIRVSRLSDPLGSRGFRATSHRISRERFVRRSVTSIALGSFAISFGLIVWNTARLPVAPPPGSPPNGIIESGLSTAIGQKGAAS